MKAENCQPPVGISDEARDYLAGLKEGERVIECGQSGITGHLGTVYISEQSGTPTVCVRWDKRPGETGSMGTTATWGTRRLKDAGTFSNADDGPYYSDGCDSDGFKGGCERAGHTPETCPSVKKAEADFQIGDTVMFHERHIAAGDYGVIVGLERWLNDNEAVPWDGVGEAPFYAGKSTTPNVERFLVRLESHNPKSNDAIGGLKSWRERCVQWPHNYPFVTPIDMQLVSRPEIKVLNTSGCLGSVVGRDDRQSLTCVSDREAGARRDMAMMKASACLPLKGHPLLPEGPIRFFAQEVTETKVADEIHSGFTFAATTLFGVGRAVVTSIDVDSGTAETRLGENLVGWLKLKEDGWYDQHTTTNMKGGTKLTFSVAEHPGRAASATPGPLRQVLPFQPVDEEVSP